MVDTGRHLPRYATGMNIKFIQKVQSMRQRKNLWHKSYFWYYFQKTYLTTFFIPQAHFRSLKACELVLFSSFQLFHYIIKVCLENICSWIGLI